MKSKHLWCKIWVQTLRLSLHSYYLPESLGHLFWSLCFLVNCCSFVLLLSSIIYNPFYSFLYCWIDYNPLFLNYVRHYCYGLSLDASLKPHEIIGRTLEADYGLKELTVELLLGDRAFWKMRVTGVMTRKLNLPPKPRPDASAFGRPYHEQLSLCPSVTFACLETSDIN